MQNITPGVDALRVIHGIIVGFFISRSPFANESNFTKRHFLPSGG